MVVPEIDRLKAKAYKSLLYNTRNTVGVDPMRARHHRTYLAGTPSGKQFDAITKGHGVRCIEQERETLRSEEMLQSRGMHQWSRKGRSLCQAWREVEML